MKLISLGRVAALFVLLVATSASAAPARAPPASLADFLKPFLILPADSGGSWDDLDKVSSIRWTTGPTMTNKPSPDGNFFARIGQASLSGRPLGVVATGARSMVFSVYIRDPGSTIDPEALVANLRQAGFAVAPARCAIDPRNTAPRRWYRVAFAKRKPAFLFAGASSNGAVYTLYLNDLPTMTQADAAAYTDSCGPAASGPPGAMPAAARPTTGQAGVAAVIEALLRPTGAPASLPWPTLTSLPALTWKAGPPMKMTNPFSDSGDDKNPRLLEGEFKTATTRMQATATGDERAASRFQLRDGQHLPRGAVFDALMRDGYAIAALRCGKVYTEMSQAWFRISGPGKQPAILYRANHSDGGLQTEDYGLWLDNSLPPILPGQTPAAGGRCPG